MSTPPEVWIDRDTVEEVTGLSVRWIEKQSACGKIAFRESEKKSANGRPLREFLLSTLPPDAQIKFAQRAATAPLTAIVPAADALPLFPPSLAAPARDAARSTLPPELEAEADARFRAIEPLLNWSKGSSFRTQDGRTIRNRDDLAAYVGAQQKPPVVPRAIWYWLYKFRKGGYAALARKPRSDRGRSRFFVEHP